MNTAKGYGATKRTRTHTITNWTDGARTYAHARPITQNPHPKLERFVKDAQLQAEAQGDHEKVRALSEFLRGLFEWQFEPKYPWTQPGEQK